MPCFVWQERQEQQAAVAIRVFPKRVPSLVIFVTRDALKPSVQTPTNSIVPMNSVLIGVLSSLNQSLVHRRLIDAPLMPEHLSA